MRILLSRLFQKSSKRLCSTTKAKAIQDVNPEDAQALENYKSKLEKRTITMFWYYNESYRKQLFLNKMLFDPKVAKTIVQKIKESSQGNQQTPVIDIDGGLSLITRILAKERSSARPLMTCAKSPFVSDFMKTIFGKRRKIKIVDFHLPDDLLTLKYGKNRHLVLSDLLSNFKNGWANPEPCCIFVGTPSLYLCRSLATACLKSLHSSPSSVANPFSECRPEFYFVVDHQTYCHLCLDQHVNIKRLNYLDLLFKTVFESQLLHVCDRAAYLPKMIRSDHEHMYLLKIRQKKDHGLDNLATFKHYEFAHFLELMCKPRAAFLIEELEKLLPGIGEDLILSRGFPVNMALKDVKLEDYVPIFNVMRRQANYDMSGFATSAQIQEKVDIQKNALIEERDPTF